MKYVDGIFSPDDQANSGMRLIAMSFDHKDRPVGWINLLPKPLDTVWTWKISGNIVSALIARPLQLVNGVNGVILGAVATVTERRKEGIASTLVDTACRHYGQLGASFAVMWARDYLLGLYEPLGFEVVFREYYCGLSVPEGNSLDVSRLSFGKFASFPHSGFDRRRLSFEKKNAESSGFWPAARTIKHGQWHGIMEGYPFAPEFSFLFAPTAGDPEFYAILGHGYKNVTIIEFAGTEEEFVVALNWVKGRFPGRPIKFNLIAAHQQVFLDAAGVTKSEQNMCTLYCPLDDRERALPMASWIDRF